MTAPKFLKLHLEMIQSLNAKLDRDVILHIGRHKTGTTTLQHCLYQNADNLAAQGIFYPQTCDPAWAQQELDAIERILAFFSSRKQSGFWDELCAHLAALPATASPYLHNLAKMSAKGKKPR